MTSEPQHRSAALDVRDLCAWYGECHVLHGLAFHVDRGEVVTLLGRNGAGKTTTMKSLVGLVDRRTGSIEFENTEIIHLPPHRIARLGVAYCPEDRGIFSSLSVAENLDLPPQVLPGGLAVVGNFRNVSKSEGAAVELRHEAVRRRAADARDRAHPAHRREIPVAGRTDRRPCAGHRAADRPHHTPAEGGRLHAASGRAEFSFRANRCRSGSMCWRAARWSTNCEATKQRPSASA